MKEDLLNGIRALRRGRGITATAVLTLALGIGANTAIFSVAHAFLLRLWQVRDPQTLTFVRARDAAGHLNDDFTRPVVERLRVPSRSLSGLAAFDGSTLTVTIDGTPQIVYGDFVTGDYFEMLGIQTTLGRVLTPDDDKLDRPPVAVIGYAYWRQRFGADPHVIGKTVTLKNLVCTIVGVTSPTYFGRGIAGNGPALTLPMAWHAALGLKDHTTFGLLGRLRPGVGPDTARSELDALYQRALAEERPTSSDPSNPATVSHIELHPGLRGDSDNGRFTREVWILQLVAGIILLLATVNVASLQLARGAGRARELATRLALGATRTRLIRQLLVESLLVSSAGGILGLAVAQWGADGLLIITRGAAPLNTTVLTVPVVAFTIALIGVATMVSGVVPALRLTRPDQASRLSTSLRTRHADHASRGGWSLIVVQVALSIVLLIPAALLIRSVDRLARVDLGYDPAHIAVLSIYPTLAGYEGPRELELYQRLLDRLDTVPGVEAASFSRFSILRRARWQGLIIHGEREINDPGASFVVDAAAPRFFDAMGVRLIAGRDFSRGDTASSGRVAVINQALAERYFPHGNAVGHALEYEGVRREIIGVSANMLFGVRDERSVPAVYIVYTQAPPDMLGQMFLKIRTVGDPTSMLPTLRREILDIAPTLAATNAGSALSQIASDSSAEASLASLVSVAGVMALFLAMVGLYGTLAQAVIRRTREIGLRIALGAQTRDVTGMILREAGQFVLMGIVIGVPGAWASARVVGSFLFGVGPSTATPTIACCAIVISVSAFAAFVPARRAARIDPLVALRRE
jgi:predicted permease